MWRVYHSHRSAILKISIAVASIIIILTGVPALAQFDNPALDHNARGRYRSNQVDGQQGQYDPYGRGQQNEHMRREPGRRAVQPDQQQRDRSNARQWQGGLRTHYGRGARTPWNASRGRYGHRYRGRSADYGSNRHDHACLWRHGHRQCS